MLGSIPLASIPIGSQSYPKNVGGEGFYLHDGVNPGFLQDAVEEFPVNAAIGRYTQLKITNTTGIFKLHSIAVVSSTADRTHTSKL